MRRTLLGGAVFGIFLGASTPIPASAQSAGGLTICNRDAEGAYLVAMVERFPILLKEFWESSGWYRIEPGACQRWSRGRVNTLYLLSVTQVTPNGRRLLDYGVDEIPEWHWNSDAYGIQEFYCVSDEPFGRKAENRSAYRSCARGEYLQLFNLHVFVEHNAEYELSLR